MPNVGANTDEVAELLYQALETEKGGVVVYETAVKCALNEELKGEWKKYLDQTRTHVQSLVRVLEVFGLDPDTETPGRKVVRHLGESLVQAMGMALDGGEPSAAQIVAAECVVLAETKDHLNWELIGELAKKLQGRGRDALEEAYGQIEEQEDEHLYHTKGWCRELWIESLGMSAVLPPPEEARDVKTAVGAERAKRARKEMLS
jgi:hypothetical protein